MEMVRYLVTPEGSAPIWQSQRAASRLSQARWAGALKTLFWVSASVALFALLTQLR
ncbi:MAG: hypothetical protein V3573_04000 [Desulfovibrionaceae bacterium]